MTPHIDFPRVQAALALLSDVSPEARLLQLENLCVNNGMWTVPKNHSDYRPVLYEISLFGVFAAADDIEQLPANWQRAARNILRGLPEEDSADLSLKTPHPQGDIHAKRKYRSHLRHA